MNRSDVAETFRRVCAWCEKELPNSDPKAKQVSHGICLDCEKELEVPAKENL